MDNKQIRKANLALLRKRYRTAGDFAEAIDTSAAYLSQIFSAKTKAEVGDELARKAEDKLGLPPGWMDVLQSPSGLPAPEKPPDGQSDYMLQGVREAWDDNTPLEDDEIEVPLYKETQFSGGDGAASKVERTNRRLRFSKSTMRASGVRSQDVACAPVIGTSMERLIMNGATVGIDTSKAGQIIDGEIYAIDHDGLLRVKYLYRLPGGGLRIRSENAEEYPEENYTAEQSHQRIRVLGWVFWWSTIRRWKGQ